MKDALVYPVGGTSACTYALDHLKKAGCKILDHPAPEVTHLLLDVPSFTPEGTLRSGGDITQILRMLPPGITVVGGNLNHPALEGYRIMDLLKDAEYLARNAAITAECALQVTAKEMGATFRDSPVLVIGWGRIGKCLGQLLWAIGAEVTIAARKESDRAMAKALGFQAVDIDGIRHALPRCKVVFNTVPELILHKEDTSGRDCVFVDLASKQGIAGADVLWARGLPGVYAPESSGKLIAETFIRKCGRDLK